MPWRAVLLALGLVFRGTHSQTYTTTGELYTFDVNTRTQYLLRNLQAGLPPLEVDEKLLEGPDGAGIDFSVPITGPDGIAYQCFADSEGTKSDKDAESGPKSKEDESPDKKLSVLRGTCAVLSQGWWSYEWCHRKEIRQFHVAQSTNPAQEPDRDPDWSLGKFKKTTIFYLDNHKTQVHSIADHFEGGQICHEIDKGRSAAVRFYCCSNTNTKLPREMKDRVKAMQAVPYALAQVVSVEETSVCNYTISVCTPLLCDPDPELPPGASIMKLLEPMQAMCITRHEGYWSYEFCHKKALRQFHTVAMRDQKGRTFSKVDAEFIIGVYQDPGKKFDEQKRIVPGKADGDPTVFELEYTNGTQCDLTGELRATTVQFICGEGGDQFVSIKEDRSCHYKAVISTPRLCRHEAFAKQLPSSRGVRCQPAKPKRRAT